MPAVRGCGWPRSDWYTRVCVRLRVVCLLVCREGVVHPHSYVGETRAVREAKKELRLGDIEREKRREGEDE